jgi:HK97 family phage portal protein
MLNNLVEKRAISFQTLWGAGSDFELGTRSATLINEETALQINAVFSAISLISNTVSTLPVDVYIRRDGDQGAFRPAPAWVQRPDIDFGDKAPFYSALTTSLLLDGNAFIRVFTNRQGEIVNLSVLNPLSVTVERTALGNVRYTVMGEPKKLTPEEVVHIIDILQPGQVRGVSRVTALKENFGLAMALEEYAARFFGQGANPAGVIEVEGNVTADQAKQLADGFDARHRNSGRRAHKTGVLSGGAKYKQTSVNPEQSQALEARRMAVEDVARAFSIPSNFLNLPGTNTYSSVEQNSLMFVKYCIRPIVEKIEGALSRLMNRYPGGERAYIKFSLDALLRADFAVRNSAYSVGLQAGFYTVNDIRRFENLQRIDDPSADTVRVPLANINVQAADLSAQQVRVRMARELVMVGYDPAETLAAFGLPPIPHTGVPSTQLQPLAQLDPTDPTSLYEATE